MSIIKFCFEISQGLILANEQINDYCIFSWQQLIRHWTMLRVNP